VVEILKEAEVFAWRQIPTYSPTSHCCDCILTDR